MTARIKKHRVHTQHAGVPYAPAYAGRSSPRWVTAFSALQSAQTNSEAHQAAYLMGKAGRAAGM